jgi:hypothetical protein
VQLVPSASLTVHWPVAESQVLQSPQLTLAQRFTAVHTPAEHSPPVVILAVLQLVLSATLTVHWPVAESQDLHGSLQTTLLVMHRLSAALAVHTPSEQEPSSLFEVVQGVLLSTLTVHWPVATSQVVHGLLHDTLLVMHKLSAVPIIVSGTHAPLPSLSEVTQVQSVGH